MEDKKLDEKGRESYKRKLAKEKKYGADRSGKANLTADGEWKKFGRNGGGGKAGNEWKSIN
jgi:hypothetical protein